ncbi:MAG TPA: molybdate ABC transporter permease subunit [Polyangiaceae bacterium]|jgi:molybdate transport system permease protein
MLSPGEASAVWLTIELAAVTTLCLLVLGTPIAWWLAHSRSLLRRPIAALVALPLILPPTVLGFYLLLLLGPNGAIGRAMLRIGMSTLPFTFPGLVVASTLYSLPFVVQPLHTAFEGVGARPLEVAATLGAGPWDRFFTVALPLARPGFVTGAMLGFAHTVGEFGVVLMIGGNIPGKTRVLSVALYDHVEALEYSDAHRLAAGLLLFSFLVLLGLYSFRVKASPV